MLTGIFGGSFNPIHNGHITLARQLLTSVGLDEIWFMVTPQNPLKKQSSLLADEVRLELVRRALEDEPQLVASDYEFHLPRPSYTWNTLQGLSHDYPDRKFALIIGGDNWQLFPRWYHADDILHNYPVVVYPRKSNPHQKGEEAAPSRRLLHEDTVAPKGGENTSFPAEGVYFVNAELLDVSSTMVRKRVQAGESIAGLVPPQLEATICQLYRHPTNPTQ